MKTTNPDKDKGCRLTKAEKKLLWMRIKDALAPRRQTSAVAPPRPFAAWLMRFRFALAFVLIALLVGGSAATVNAANKAVPGDALFPLDLTLEKVQLVFSSGQKKDTLRVRFAEERLKEVKLVLVAEESKIAVNTGEGAGESGENTTDDEENTEEGLPEDNGAEAAEMANGTSTEEATESADEGKKEKDIKNITKAETALLVAIEHLEKEREILNERGNAAAALIIGDIIDELSEIAETHVEKLDTLIIKDRGRSGKISIALEASSDKVKTKFNFERKGNGNGNGKSEIRLKNDDEESEIKVKAGNARFKFVAKKNNNDEEDENENNENGDGNGEENETEGENGENDDGKADKADKDKRGNGQEKINICHKTGNGMKITLNVAKPAARAHIAHGDILGKCDGEEEEEDNEENEEEEDEEGEEDEEEDDESGEEDENDTSTTTPDTAAPTLLNIEISATTTSAEVAWTTDEAAGSKVWYATTFPVIAGSGGSAMVGSSALVLEHSILLNGISASTTYYILVVSTDEAGNTATSSEHSFITPSEAEEEPEDTTAPTVSSVTAGDITATSTLVSWSTDEEANGTVWYGTTTPVTMSNDTSFVREETFTLSHALPLEGLTASTTYYYLASSADEAGNEAVSSEQTFATEEQ